MASNPDQWMWTWVTVVVCRSNSHLQTSHSLFMSYHDNLTSYRPLVWLWFEPRLFVYPASNPDQRMRTLWQNNGFRHSLTRHDCLLLTWNTKLCTLALDNADKQSTSSHTMVPEEHLILNCPRRDGRPGPQSTSTVLSKPAIEQRDQLSSPLFMHLLVKTVFQWFWNMPMLPTQYQEAFLTDWMFQLISRRAIVWQCEQTAVFT